MKIAIVRGPFLNKWEMQNFEPLLDGNEVTAFSTGSNVFPVDEIKIPVKRLFCLDNMLAPVSLKSASYFNRATGKVFGWNYYMYGLENSLQGYDIVNTVELHHTFTNQVMNAKKRFGFKVAVTVWENIPFIWDKHPVRRQIKQNVINNADLFIAVTENIKKRLLIEGVAENKIIVQNYGVDLNRFKPEIKDDELMNKFGISKNDVVILYTGRFVWEKGIYDLLYAAKKILSDNEINIPVKFLFVGEGREKNRVIKLIDKLGLADSVKTGNNLSYNMIPKLHNLADIFVLPSIPTKSWQEQFGFVLIESMACGKPVVTTATGSIPDVAGDAAVLIPPNDYINLYIQLKKLILNNTYRQESGNKSYMLAKQKYDSSMVGSKLNEIFRSMQ